MSTPPPTYVSAFCEPELLFDAHLQAVTTPTGLEQSFEATLRALTSRVVEKVSARSRRSRRLVRAPQGLRSNTETVNNQQRPSGGPPKSDHASSPRPRTRRSLTPLALHPLLPARLTCSGAPFQLLRVSSLVPTMSCRRQSPLALLDRLLSKQLRYRRLLLSPPTRMGTNSSP